MYLTWAVIILFVFGVWWIWGRGKKVATPVTELLPPSIVQAGPVLVVKADAPKTILTINTDFVTPFIRNTTTSDLDLVLSKYLSTKVREGFQLDAQSLQRIAISEFGKNVTPFYGINSPFDNQTLTLTSSSGLIRPLMVFGYSSGDFNLTYYVSLGVEDVVLQVFNSRSATLLAYPEAVPSDQTEQTVVIDQENQVQTQLVFA